MKRTFAILLMLLCPILTNAQDTLKVHESVTDYFRSIIAEPIDTIIARVDSLIARTPDPQSQATVAGLAFNFFSESPLMGQEAVAVHIADSCFLNKRLKWGDDQTYVKLYTFAEFNRQSLIGRSAPQLRMQGIDSIQVSMREVVSPYKVLFFYEPQCSTCRKTTPKLVEFASSYKGPHLTIFAVYVQSDHAQWRQYVEENFAMVDNPDVTVLHMWDPEFESDFQRKYGVITLPSLFLLDDQNVIIGRKLDVDALRGLLDLKSAEGMQYTALFGRIFDSMRPLTYDDASIVSAAFAKRTQADTVLFRNTMYSLFQYYRNSTEPELQKGAFDLAERYIVERPEYWSDEYVRSVIHQLEMEKLNPVGAYAPDVALYDRKGRRKSLLDCSEVNHLIMFHLIDCQECSSEIADLRKMDRLLYDAEISVTLVYVGKDGVKWREFAKKMPSRWRCLWDSDANSGLRDVYDLEYVPHAYLLDGSDRIIGKNFKIRSLKNIIY